MFLESRLSIQVLSEVGKAVVGIAGIRFMSLFRNGSPGVSETNIP